MTDMKILKNIFGMARAMAMVGGSVASIGIAVGLYSGILPEHNPVIKFSEIGFFLLCIPVLLREAWQILQVYKMTKRILFSLLITMTSCLCVLLTIAEINGGILNMQLLIVISLMALILVIVSFGSSALRQGLSRIVSIHNYNFSAD